jgi:outer membrane lipase/esterase
MIASGANDLIYAQTTTTVLPSNYLATQANTLVSRVASLQAAGARTITVLNILNYARLVDASGNIPAADADKLVQSTAFAQQLWGGMAAAGVNFVPVDVDNLFKYVSKNPTKFGFTAANVLSMNPAVTTSSALIASPSQLVSPDAEQTHLFSDSKHLSAAGQVIEADYMYNLLTAPGQISLLAESAVQGGLARTSLLQGQFALSAQDRSAKGTKAWFKVGVQDLRLKNSANFPTSSGSPVSGTVGVDFLAQSGVLLGAAITAEDQTQDYSTGGHFDQSSETLSLYAATRTGALSGSAVLSYGLLQNSVARQTITGRFTDLNTGDTRGHSLGLGLRGVYELQVGAFSTGPVVGLVLQKQRVDAFTETGVSGVSALSYGRQSRNSAVSQVGWSGALKLGQLQPFAAVEWNHEWTGRGRAVLSSITTMSAPSYFSEAAPIATNWGTVALGVSFKLSTQLELRASASSVFGSSRLTSSGGDLSLKYSF